MSTKFNFKSPLRYPGGKSRVAKFLVDKFPKFHNYREPFFGGGSVYFALRSKDLNHGIDHTYWVNDLFIPIYLFWLTAQSTDANRELVRRLRDFKEFTDRRNFEDNVNTLKRVRESIEELSQTGESASLRDGVDGAKLAFVLNRCTFSGALLKGGFTRNAFEGRWTNSSINRIVPMVLALMGVTITGVDCIQVIEQPGDDTFIFLDPPYTGAEGLYSIHDLDHVGLATSLRKTPHKFLMTYNDCQAIRDLYDWANIQEFRVQYGMDNAGGKPCKSGAELLISNY